MRFAVPEKSTTMRSFLLITVTSYSLSGHGALYSHRTFPTTISMCVRLSSALWQNGCPDMDAVWDGRSDGSRDEAGTVGFEDRSTRLGSSGGECVVLHCNQCGVCGVAVRKCVNRQSCSLGWCVALVATRPVSKLLWAILLSLTVVCAVRWRFPHQFCESLYLVYLSVCVCS